MFTSETRSCLMILLTSFFLISCVQSNKTQKQSSDPFASLTIYGKLPEFSATTDLDSIVNAAMLKNKICLVSFFFSSCGDICPKLNAVKHAIVKKNGSDKLRFVSVTVDPNTDVPSTMRNHRQLMGFTDKRWLFVRMHNDTILEQFMNGMLIGYAENPQNHTARLILVDSLSRIRGYFDALDRKQIDSLQSILKKVQ